MADRLSHFPISPFPHSPTSSFPHFLISSPTPPPADERVRVWLCRPGSTQCEPIPPERISDVLQDPKALLWVDVREPGPEEFEMLREEFGFHRLALEDASKQVQRPKVDEYPGYFFVVL